ncbi:PHD-finger [Teladorsagia circumcincta]|uniref:PHD-finger n=1 Tax=Teladorsagia circumcincta TaxID=45464 RepID=A0A2G9TY60_TELCI|nr:PHD-finger [Teladorsagia circumcincta]
MLQYVIRHCSCIDSILDDRYPFLDGNNRRNYYIIRSDGRLAEVFRTDLFDRLRKGIGANEESDDDDVSGSGLARMSDSVLQERRDSIKGFFDNAYEPIQTKPLRLYECNALDEVWVKLFNEHRMHTKCPSLPMEAFLEIMNEFEVECYTNIHRKLLEPLHSPSSRIEDGDEEAACDICLAVDSEPDDEMVFCDGCNLCVHMSCYGLQELPPDEWLCMKCRLCYGRNPSCLLCPTIGGALKCTDTNQWAHVVCALWIPECRFGDFEKREPIIRINEIKEERWSAKCTVCDTRQGACIKCTVDSCTSSFHATCALRSGLEMRIEQDPVDDRIHMISLCPRHRSAKPFVKDEVVCEPSQAASDDETAGQYGCSPLTKLEQTCYEFVDHAGVAAKLELDPLLVADVFAYWVKKRLHLNNGKPLIENLQDEIKIVEPEPPQLELPAYIEYSSYLSSPSVPPKRKRGRPRKHPVDQSETPSTPETKVVDAKVLHAKEKLERSLCEGRRMLDLVVRRSKEQRNFLHAHMGALLLITEHLSKPVPLSHRTDRFLNETLQNLCSKEVIEEGERRADEICGLNGLVIPKAHFSRRVSSPKSISRRSLSNPREYPRKRASRQSRITFDEEQRNNRRKSLRSSGAKSTDVEYQSMMHDPVADSTSGNHDESSLLLRDSNHQDEKAIEVAPAKGSATSKRDEKEDTSIRHDLSVEKTQSSSKGSKRKSRTGRKSDKKAALSGTESPSPKRHRSAHAPETELRLLKSVNLKNANKDFKNREASRSGKEANEKTSVMSEMFSERYGVCRSEKTSFEESICCVQLF